MTFSQMSKLPIIGKLIIRYPNWKPLVNNIATIVFFYKRKSYLRKEIDTVTQNKKCGYIKIN